MPEVSRPPAAYLQIAAHYREQIRAGQLRQGDRVPSTRQIVREWGVAHATAARALDQLRAEHLVVTQAGGGGGTVVYEAPQAPSESTERESTTLPATQIRDAYQAAMAGRVVYLMDSDGVCRVAVIPADLVEPRPLRSRTDSAE